MIDVWPVSGLGVFYGNDNSMTQFTLSLYEILALIGMLQCAYLVGYILFRSGHGWNVFIPVLYFLILGGCFLSDFSLGGLALWGDLSFTLQWFFWFSGPPLSVLLVIQLSDMKRFPPLREALILLLVPASFIVAVMVSYYVLHCDLFSSCVLRREMLTVMGLVSGTISLLFIFGKKDMWQRLSRARGAARYDQKNDKARYWLILSLIVLNSVFLFITLLGLTVRLDISQVLALRNVTGLGFVYLVSTSLLRIYPQIPKMDAALSATGDVLNEEEMALAGRIENFLDLEKVYQEPTYSRADLARECAVPEGVVSRVINLYFQKSFPQLMNERRIADAKRLLRETDAPVQVISSEVGFNSLPSFNRVFKELTGDSPSQFRKAGKQG